MITSTFTAGNGFWFTSPRPLGDGMAVAVSGSQAPRNTGTTIG